MLLLPPCTGTVHRHALHSYTLLYIQRCLAKECGLYNIFHTVVQFVELLVPYDYFQNLDIVIHTIQRLGGWETAV